MNPLLRGGNLLLFRSYMMLAGGLLIVAVLLDFGFSRLQQDEKPETDRWLEATFQLLESRLMEETSANRAAVAAKIGAELGVDVQLLTRNDVHQGSGRSQDLIPLIDADGNTSYLYDAKDIDAIIRLGPIAESEESLLLKLLPPIFYLSIFIVVGLWLRPILRDVNIISNSAQRFAADYRDPLDTAERTTELKSLARNLDDMAARLSGVLRSQKELIAALSHEMRTPLARLRFALAISHDQADETLSKRLADMNADVQAIDDLIASMLNYARLDHPDIEMHWQAVPVKPWLRRLLDTAHQNTITVHARSEDAADEMRMDPRLMELALSNLLVNAVKYASKNVVCTVAQHDGQCILSVEDDGQGIAEGEREKVFKAFSRIDDSRNRQTGGYGLGLAVVARVAELHGGTARVDTSPELGGARVTVRWPASGHTY